jgi:hypothetical protein
MNIYSTFRTVRYWLWSRHFLAFLLKSNKLHGIKRREETGGRKVWNVGDETTDSLDWCQCPGAGGYTMVSCRGNQSGFSRREMGLIKDSVVLG